MFKLNRVFIICSMIFLGVSCSTDDSSGENLINKADNTKRLGTSANDLLSDEEFTAMNIEILYVEGYAPEVATIEEFKNFLEERTYKPDGINISLRPVNSSGEAPFEIDEIAEIESNERTAYNAGDEIAIFIYFADGKNEEDEDNRIVLGSAFRNTSIVIYGETVKTFANRANAPKKSTIETAVLNHEFGHLFGLVNLGATLQSDHEDEVNEKHCTTQGCLMRASIEFGGSIVDVIDGEKVPELGTYCLQDLQAMGGK